MRPRGKRPRSPPFVAEPGSSPLAVLRVVVLRLLGGRRDRLRELGRGEAHEGDVHLLVVETVLLLDLGIAHLRAVRDECVEALEEDAHPELLFELALIALIAEE